MTTAEYRIELINSNKQRPFPFNIAATPWDLLAVDADIDQDWGLMTTTYHYPDGSSVLASGGHYEVIS